MSEQTRRLQGFDQKRCLYRSHSKYLCSHIKTTEMCRDQDNPFTLLQSLFKITPAIRRYAALDITKPHVGYLDQVEVVPGYIS